jgi:hypothetical protein
MKLAALAAVSLLSLSTACGGGSSGGASSDGGGTPPTPGPETAALYCDELYTTFATRYADCSKAALAWATHTIDKTKLCAGVERAVSRNLATYDRTAAGKCLAFFDSASCTDLRAIRDDVKYLPDCRAAVVGKGASGYPITSCASDNECASGRCYAGTCPGSCYAGAVQGQSCSLDRDCAAGLYCFMGAPYAGSTCQPHDNRPNEGAVCTIETGCKPGLYCDGSTNYLQKGTCKPQVSAGTCPTNAAAMAPGFRCFSGATQPLLGPGAACEPVADRCGPGLYCGSGTCKQLPSVGEPCVYANSEWQGCIGGYCDALGSGMCVAGLTGNCYSDWDCESKGVCDSGCQTFCY